MYDRLFLCRALINGHRQPTQILERANVLSLTNKNTTMSMKTKERPRPAFAAHIAPATTCRADRGRAPGRVARQRQRHPVVAAHALPG